MSYTEQILILRDKMHKDIIHTTQKADLTGDDFDIELNKPFKVWITEDYGDDYQVKIIIKGVSGNTGELLTEGFTVTGYCDVNYNDLTMEQLAYLHSQIQTNQFTINIL
jgi:hypothetical protein